MPNDTPPSANEKLREERLKRGWSQQKLADELGIAVVTVNRWERGKQQPTGYYRLKLSTLFDKSAEELGLSGEANEPESITSIEELQEHMKEIAPVSPTEQEETTRDIILDRPSSEKMSHLPFSDKPFARTSLNKRSKSKILLFLILIFLVIATPITFFLLRFARTSGPSSHSSHSSPSSPALFIVLSKWKMALNDPLTTAHHDNQWIDDGSQCIFRSDGYYAISQGTNYCNYGEFSVNNFSDMAYSIDITFYKGTMGGLVFRLINNNYYGFYITVTGKYCILWHTNSDGGDDSFLITPQLNPAIHKGFKQKNTLSVLARGTSLKFWINGQLVKKLTNNKYKSGTIGTFSGDPTNGSKPTTEASFNNAKVWIP